MIDISCSYCKSHRVVKKGTRKNKLQTVQLYYCKKCNRRFSRTSLPTYTFPAQAIITAPILYYQGYTLAKIVSLLKARFSIKPALSTVATWVADYGYLCALKNNRSDIQAYSSPGKLIARKVFMHEQKYLFQMHRYKCDRIIPPVFHALKEYLETIAFTASINSAQYTLRASSTFLNISFQKYPESTKGHYLCKVAEIALRGVLSNYQRHAFLQKFLLATDKATLAVEVPVYLSDKETRSILHVAGGLLGHIDFVQIFHNKIIILDYKPNARAEKKVHEQLLIYAIALSVRTGIHLRDMECAWFDEKDYYSIPAIELYAHKKTMHTEKQTNNNLYTANR